MNQDSNIVDIFNSLQLPDWRINGHELKGGGQARVVPVKTRNGKSGVLRVLEKAKPVAVKRFNREIGILTASEYQHPNIIEIYDYGVSSDNCWYISKRGHSFKKYWKSKRSSFKKAPQRLLNTAIEVIRGVCEGLSKLHQADIFHRDIKVENIVEIAGKAVLIDFGVAYAADAPRISVLEDAVGNRRFSPDPMRYRMANPTPWLDVFMISQLFMWMLAADPGKDWIRPLHWKYVRYPEKLSDQALLSIRALTCICSEEDIGPKNAGQLLQAVDSLFDLSDNIHMDLESLTAKIKASLAKGNEAERKRAAERLLQTEDNHRVITNSTPIFRLHLPRIHELIGQLYERIKTDGGFYCRLNFDNIEKADGWLNSVKMRHAEIRHSDSLRIFSMNIGPDEKRAFEFRMTLNYWAPDNRAPEDNVNVYLPFSVDIRPSVNHSNRGAYGPYVMVRFGFDGKLYSEHYEEIDLDGIRQRIEALLSDDKFWQQPPENASPIEFPVNGDV